MSGAITSGAGGARGGAPTLRVRGGATGVEAYTRVTLYCFAFLEPLMLLAMVGALATDPAEPTSARPLALVVLAVGLAHLVACLATTRAGLTRRTGRWRRRALGALAVTGGAGVAVALVLLPTGGMPYFSQDPRSAMIIAVGQFSCGALAVTARLRGLLLGAVGTGALAGAGALLDRTAGEAAALVGIGFTVTLAYAGSIRLTVWILDVVRALDSARAAEARLAVAEERLRFSRDLHDVVGRALSAVAVKSELAAELARRDDPRAVGEMLAVRSLAQDSLREARGVVAGYRAVDLDAELAGARSLLASAGIATRIVGDVGRLPAPVQEALAWVVREAVTNVVRHSEARTCTLDVAVDDDQVRLRVVNDGLARVAADRGADGSGGSGLAGLRERLAAVGGTLTAGRDGARFVLEAHAPRGPGAQVAA
ncbi:sensor histidine kinase [Xylanimonas ulmi]|uniref:Two-component system sensor histidine kinase DesK n=1 Tax=Xylanimonas ulmi TaxID=228973 RepID=A0A4Q7M3V9_9MICO|nr:histidine kinase [Xylanibacterium ulmi]RZS61188.1 two-component system sensor histidine kinase DesK [Xylanibacterium ulmi]